MQPLAVDVREAARLLSVSPFSIRIWAKKGRIFTVKAGTRRLVPMSEIERIAREGLSSSDQPKGDA